MRFITFEAVNGVSTVENLFSALEKLFSDPCNLEDGEFISSIEFKKDNIYTVCIKISCAETEFDEALKAAIEHIVRSI